MRTLKFRLDEEKALEALCFVAERWPGVTPFRLSQTLFHAEREHLNRYGRPVFGDTYIATKHGPVASVVCRVFDGDLAFAADPAAFELALDVRCVDGGSRMFARRPADTDALSDTDIECLNGSIAWCRKRSQTTLSQEALGHRAWFETPICRTINYALMIDEYNPAGETILDDAFEYAAYGVS